MLSPTSHRIVTVGTVIAVVVLILLTLYNLRDHRIASPGLLSQISSHKKDAAVIPTYDTTKSTSSLFHKHRNKQDTVKIPANKSSPSAIAVISAVEVTASSVAVAANEPKNAFVTFLEADTGTNRGDQGDGMNLDDEDIYFVGMLFLPSCLMSPDH